MSNISMINIPLGICLQRPIHCFSMIPGNDELLTAAPNGTPPLYYK